MPCNCKWLATPSAWRSGSLASFHVANWSQVLPSCWSSHCNSNASCMYYFDLNFVLLFTVFLHWPQVIDPQSGHMRRFWRGRAKNPDEHFKSIPVKSKSYQLVAIQHKKTKELLTCMHHLKFGSCISVRSRSFLWNSSWTASSRIFFSCISKLEKYSSASSSVRSVALRSGSLQNGHEQSVILRSVIYTPRNIFTCSKNRITKSKTE